MNNSFFKKKTFRSMKYKKFISNQACCNCHVPAPSDPHHEALPGQRGTGIKAPDSQCLPLCHECHVFRHQKGAKSFWENMDIRTLMVYYLTKYLSLNEGYHD